MDTEELPIEPVDPTVIMQFSRYDAFGNLLVKIHRRSGAYDRRILKAEDGQRMMTFLGRVLVESLDDVNVEIPFPLSHSPLQ